MNSPHVFDKAKYHDETIQEYGLPEEHAANHTVFFLRWLIEHDLMSEEFLKESGDTLARFRVGKATIYELYEWWDCCLIDNMLSAAGNAFALHYFDFDHGKYLQDYSATLQEKLPTEFHVQYSEENYKKLKAVIDRRYEECKTPKKKGSWFRQFFLKNRS